MHDQIDWRKEKYKHLWEEVRSACAHYLLACDSLEDALMDVKEAMKRCKQVYSELQFENLSDKCKEFEDLIAFMDEVSRTAVKISRVNCVEKLLAMLREKKADQLVKRDAILAMKEAIMAKKEKGRKV